MAVTIDKILDGMLARINTLPGVPSEFTLFKEQFDLSGQTQSKAITALFEGGQGHTRTPVDLLRFTVVACGSTYSEAREVALEIYNDFDGMFDVLADDPTDWGWNSYWMLDPPAYEPSKNLDPKLRHLYFFIIPCRTYAETRGA